MKKLINGIIDFREHSLAEYRAKFSKLAAGQSPDTLFIACCDSRVVPNVFASTDPGDLFVLRNIGNLIPPYVQASHEPDNTDMSVGAAIEFSLQVLKVTSIIVCGHSECGAMQALLADSVNRKQALINKWLRYAWPTYKSFSKGITLPHLDPTLSKHNQLSQLNVLEQIKHLETYPLVQEKLASKEVTLYGWWFDLATADVHYYDAHLHQFLVIDQHSANTLLKQSS